MTALPTLSQYLKTTSTFLSKTLQPQSSVEINILKTILPPAHCINVNMNQDVRYNFVIGNQAGDTDSCISSLLLAYILTLEQFAPTTSPQAPSHYTFTNPLNVVHIPILSFKETEMTLKPDTSLLLNIFNIHQSSLTFIDNHRFHYLAEIDRSTVSLTDHNSFVPHACLPSTLTKDVMDKVCYIVDHHIDTAHSHTFLCNTVDARNIVTPLGSACTLVSERYTSASPATTMPKNEHKNVILPLLLGVILMDTNNMSVNSGKGTARDKKEIDFITQTVDWKDVTINTGGRYPVDESDESSPNLKGISNLLRDARFDPVFWGALDVMGMVSVDYKKFGTDKVEFGMSSVLVTSAAFISKYDVSSDEKLVRFMESEGTKFVVIMAMKAKKGVVPKRELTIICDESERGKALLDMLARFLLGAEEAQVLEVREEENGVGGENASASASMVKLRESGRCRLFDQFNVKGSRKEVGPIIVGFLNGLDAVGKR